MTNGFAPTHTVPAPGLSAWTQPDPAAAPVAQLYGGMPVVLVAQQGDWAHIRCDNGWEGWTDARYLQPWSPPPDPLLVAMEQGRQLLDDYQARRVDEATFRARASEVGAAISRAAGG